MKDLSYSVVHVSHTGVEFSATAITTAKDDPKCNWGSRRSEACIELRLAVPAVLAVVEFFNLGTKSVAVEVAQRATKQARFLRVAREPCLPRGRRVAVRSGCLPCGSVRLRFLGGSPISLRGIRLRGLPASDMDHRMGPSGTSLLVHRPSFFLFGPSLDAASKGRGTASPPPKRAAPAPTELRQVMEHLEKRRTDRKMQEQELRWWTDRAGNLQ